MKGVKAHSKGDLDFDISLDMDPDKVKHIISRSLNLDNGQEMDHWYHPESGTMTKTKYFPDNMVMFVFPMDLVIMAKILDEALFKYVFRLLKDSPYDLYQTFIEDEFEVTLAEALEDPDLVDGSFWILERFNDLYSRESSPTLAEVRLGSEYVHFDDLGHIPMSVLKAIDGLLDVPELSVFPQFGDCNDFHGSCADMMAQHFLMVDSLEDSPYTDMEMEMRGEMINSSEMNMIAEYYCMRDPDGKIVNHNLSDMRKWRRILNEYGPNMELFENYLKKLWQERYDKSLYEVLSSKKFAWSPRS